MSGDEGLFGPRSVTWQLHADPAMWVAGVSALFLQALHPLAVRGVLQNSDFRTDPLGRLMKTALFVSVSTYGTAEAAEQAGARVRRIHAALRVDGTHRVDDPELLRWVHCAEVWSYQDVVRRAGFPLTDALADRYLTEQRASAALVGLDPAAVPGTREEMSLFFERSRPQLRRTAESDEIYAFLMYPPVNPPMRAGWQPIGRLAYSLLPSWATELYGRRPIPVRAAERRLRLLRKAALLVPSHLRWRGRKGNIPRAMARLGPAARPSPGNL
ncbi:oxygenase MpaB family protein [Longispora albida]|uniref:oxygenase MpaB family protein n=1 Tax=Longispora albida TaxID=203523 RepID=UPI00037BEC07|nr:oxygenase MpaB family protein [Longispora albida]